MKQSQKVPLSQEELKFYQEACEKLKKYNDTQDEKYKPNFTMEQKIKLSRIAGIVMTNTVNEFIAIDNKDS